MAEAASGSVAVSQTGSSQWQYTITLNDTGSTTIGTLWFAWVPGQDFLATSPDTISAPAGWTAIVTHGGSSDGYAIQFVASSTSSYIQPGGSLSGFSFVSSDPPSSVFGDSVFHPGTPVTTSFVYSGAPFSDGGFDTVLSCFMSGTSIRTQSGEVAVETLKRGDMVTASNGIARPVSWIGRRAVSTRFGDPLRVLPIRIKAGAFSENVPSRDLLLSPDHAILVDGVLIQTGALVNGTSIVRETNVPETFIYYHVELEDHSLILAENTPAETFVDNVGRLGFDNRDEYEALYPDGKTIVEMPYPRAKAHRQVPRKIRERLAERGSRLYGGLTVAA
jgi:Hint domain